jgi:hypothetical protein
VGGEGFGPGQDGAIFASVKVASSDDLPCWTWRFSKLAKKSQMISV